jgi:hypothetical protein
VSSKHSRIAFGKINTCPDLIKGTMTSEPPEVKPIRLEPPEVKLMEILSHQR